MEYLLPAPQVLLDRSTPFILYRWLALLGVALIYAVRVYFLHGCARSTSTAATMRLAGSLAARSVRGHHAALQQGTGCTALSAAARRCRVALGHPAPTSPGPAAAPFPRCRFYIVTYALGIYNLNLFLGFLTPQMDPEHEGPVLPSKSDEEFRPFVRKLPEFKFW